MIKVLSPYIGCRITVQYSNTDELLEFIVKYEGILQTTMIQFDIATERTRELGLQMMDQKAILEDAYNALRSHLEAKATVPLTCQRCLHPVPTELLIEQDFRFVADEATALAEDDASEEDLLVLEDSFNLQALIEDELLMSLPLVPMHPACMSEQAPTSKEEAALLAEARPNPFAVLASLKTRKH